MLPWNLIITAVVQGAPLLISELMALYDKHKSGTPVTAEDWVTFETKFLASTAEQRLTAIARRMS